MIHHYSVSVPDPKSTIEKLKCLFGGKITRFGPLEGGYILWFGDQHGTAIELYPSGAEMFPGKKGEGGAMWVGALMARWGTANRVASHKLPK